MRVKELREYLAQFPDDMEVLETRYSDLGPMSLESWSQIRGIPEVSGEDGWVRRVWRDNATFSDTNLKRIQNYLHYGGN